MMLLNATPNTDGLIPEGDMARYHELGAELKRRFANPLAQTSGPGKIHTLRFDRPTRINQAMVMEDYRHGERIRGYVIKIRRLDGTWQTVNTGLSVGRKRIVMFEPVTTTQVTLQITENVNEPLTRGFFVYSVEGDNAFLYETPVLKRAALQPVPGPQPAMSTARPNWRETAATATGPPDGPQDRNGAPPKR